MERRLMGMCYGYRYLDHAYIPLLHRLVKIAPSQRAGDSLVVMDPEETIRVAGLSLDDFCSDQEWIGAGRVWVRPTGAFFLISDACDLECAYCYSRCTRDMGKRSAHMRFDTAIALVKAILANCRVRQLMGMRTVADLVLCGGGEPTLNWNVGVEIVRKAKEMGSRLGVDVRVRLISNAQWDDELTESIASIVDDITISFDGPRHVQESQRPRIDGRSSYDVACTNMRRIVSLGKNISVRATITAQTQAMLPELVAGFAEIGCATVQLEPLFEYTYGLGNDLGPVDPEVLSDSYMAARSVARSLGVSLICSCDILDEVVGEGTSCLHDTGRMVTLTTEGQITACPQVTSPTDPMFHIFRVGEVSRGQVSIASAMRNEELLHTMPERCSKCFARRACSGGCRMRRIARRLEQSAGNDCFCQTTRSIAMSRIKEMIAGLA